MKLNLGCGKSSLVGFINCDNNDKAAYDQKLDVTSGLPWPDDSIEQVHCGNLFDSLTREDFNKLMREIWRVLEHGGLFTFEQMDVTKNFDMGIGWPYFVTPVTRYLFNYYEVGNDAYENWKEIYNLPGFILKRPEDITHNKNGVMIGKMSKP